MVTRVGDVVVLVVACRASYHIMAQGVWYDAITGGVVVLVVVCRASYHVMARGVWYDAITRGADRVVL